jgi:hypothetical protein
MIFDMLTFWNGDRETEYHEAAVWAEGEERQRCGACGLMDVMDSWLRLRWDGGRAGGVAVGGVIRVYIYMCVYV